jgi:hypothetical protein
MENIKRITPEEVLWSYNETGLKPRQRTFFGDGSCACGLAVLYKANGGEDLCGDAVVDYAKQKRSRLYVSAFMDGFDGFKYELEGKGFFEHLAKVYKDFSMETYLAGYQDGKESWELASKELLNQEG